jgi:hypothetical protein
MELNNFQYLGIVSIFSDTGKCFSSINNWERYPMNQGSWFVSKRELLAMIYGLDLVARACLARASH